MRDVLSILRREMSHRLREPVWVIMQLGQPILFMFFFGPILKQFVVHTPGFPPGTAWTIFTPALMLQMVLIGASTVGVAFLAEYRSGTFERFRVTPMRPSSLLLGKVLCVTLSVLVQSSVLVLICQLFFGLDTTVPGMLASFGMVALLSVALSSFSYGLTLRIPSEQALPAALNAMLLPLILLSGTLLPITAELAPAWLYRLSLLNPVAHVMTATRAFFRGDFSVEATWSGVVSVVVMSVGALCFGIRTFGRNDLK
ncbi:ABC transporter permease [Micromonospora sp. NPDC050276]|uniref:ABC transporter permease n=1 Tax=Micromonospora sp. NPDC050276 TaxID=3364278 RepID=UPI0037AD6105